MNRSLISPASSSCSRFLAASVGLVVLTLSFAALFVAVSADAACSGPRERGSGSILQLPLVIASHAGNQHENDGPGQNASIVGLWHVTTSWSQCSFCSPDIPENLLDFQLICIHNVWQRYPPISTTEVRS